MKTNHVILVALALTMANSWGQDAKLEIERRLHIAFQNKGFGQCQYGYSTVNCSSRWESTDITIFEVAYRDNYIADYWSPERVRELYAEISRSNSFDYLFCKDVHIVNNKDVYIADGFVFTMFEQQDLRFVRCIVVFDKSKATIVYLGSSLNAETMNEILFSMGYRTGGINEGYSWKNHEESQFRLGESIRNNTTGIMQLQQWFADTETVLKAML